MSRHLSLAFARHSTLVIAGLFAASSSAAQTAGSTPPRPDYARAEQFFTWNLEKRVFRDRIETRWLKDGNRFWYRVKTRGGHEFQLVDPTANTKRLVFDNARLAAALSLAIDSTLDPGKLPFTTFEFGASEQEIEFRAGKRQFRCSVGGYTCARIDTIPDRTRLSRKSPDGKWEAFAFRNNLYIRPASCAIATEGGNGGVNALGTCGDSIPLTADGDSLRAYGAQTVPLGGPSDTIKRAPSLQWSPDSRLIAVTRSDMRGVKLLPLYSSTSTRPKSYLFPYGQPGDSVIARFDIHVLDVASRGNVRVQTNQIPAINDVGYMTDSILLPVKWSPNADRLFYIDVTRGAKRAALMSADPKTGAVRRLASDSATGTSTIDVGPSSGATGLAWRATEREDDAWWFSARDGWGHIYRFDGNGKVRTQVTSGPWSVRTLHYADAKAGSVYITVRGRDPERFLYHNYVYRIGADGSGMTLLTPEPANHVATFSPSGKFFIDSYSDFDDPPVTVLRSSIDGRVIRELERADVSDLRQMGFRPPEPFRAVAADGASEIWGIVWRPSQFDSTMTYPVVDYIYPVPGANISQWGYMLPDVMEPRALAELGFVVTQIMGRGTGSRSKAFLDAYQGRMGQNTVPDHVTAIQQLGARHRWIDLSRVGIYGHSGGGYASTAAILRFPDFFKVAVSSNGNHDNRTYGAFWGEKYQGLLTRDSITKKDNYEAEANYTLAANLKGKLLLLMSDMDDNVPPASTLRLVHALIAANRKFDMMVFPDRGHGLSEPYAHRMRFDYFVRHLMGVEPPEYTFTR